MKFGWSKGVGRLAGGRWESPSASSSWLYTLDSKVYQGAGGVSNGYWVINHFKWCPVDLILGILELCRSTVIELIYSVTLLCHNISTILQRSANFHIGKNVLDFIP